MLPSTKLGSLSGFELRMATLTIERTGGVAGIGLASSRIRSRGQVEWESLSAADRAAVDALFARRGSPAGVGPLRDSFTYRLTRPSGNSTESVEVGEALVPAALSRSVKDQLI